MDFQLYCSWEAPRAEQRRNPINFAAFFGLELAPRLLLKRVSGGYSGPASRSGVPLEQPPLQKIPAWLQGRSKIDLPAPPCTSSFQLPAPSSPLLRSWFVESALRGSLLDAVAEAARTQR